MKLRILKVYSGFIVQKKYWFGWSSNIFKDGNKNPFIFMYQHSAFEAIEDYRLEIEIEKKKSNFKNKVVWTNKQNKTL